jgi:hypothetical protein
MKLRKIALGIVAIAAVIALFATGPEVGQVWSQVANAQLNIVNTHEGHELVLDISIGQQHHLDDQIHLEQAPPLEIEPHH